MIVEKRFVRFDVSGFVEDKKTGFLHNEESVLGILNEFSEKAERATPIENGKNRYGVDVAYFRRTINRELNRPLTDHTPQELARVLARLSRTAAPEVMHEPEFKLEKPFKGRTQRNTGE